MSPHGVAEDSGWALARLNDGSSPSTGTFNYRYPESSRPVRLYLIDSAVDNTSGWFDGNTNLTFVQGKQLRIPGGGNPPVPYNPSVHATTNDHGTRILSIIAGPELGAACGIPVELYSYDVYPDDSSDLGRLTSAIGRATLDKLMNPGILGVVCIANGTDDPAINSELHTAIVNAINAGLVVVVSAGNKAADVLNGHERGDVIAHEQAAYLPAAYGSSLDGLITVGASDQNNAKTSISNHGDAVDLWAPGVDVLTFDPANKDGGQSSPMHGTSPAAAIVAAAAIAELSRQPSLSPAEVEDALNERLYPGTVPIVQIDDDLDADGSVDELERFFGYPINDAGSTPPAPGFAVTNSTSELSFTINADLWQPDDPMNLSDSSAWRLLASSDLLNWVVVEPEIIVGTEIAGRIPITARASIASIPASEAAEEPGVAQTVVTPSPERIFYRIEVIPNPPPSLATSGASTHAPEE